MNKPASPLPHPKASAFRFSRIRNHPEGPIHAPGRVRGTTIHAGSEARVTHFERLLYSASLHDPPFIFISSLLSPKTNTFRTDPRLPRAACLFSILHVAPPLERAVGSRDMHVKTVGHRGPPLWGSQHQHVNCI